MSWDIVSNLIVKLSSGKQPLSLVIDYSNLYSMINTDCFDTSHKIFVAFLKKNKIRFRHEQNMKRYRIFFDKISTSPVISSPPSDFIEL